MKNRVTGTNGDWVEIIREFSQDLQEEEYTAIGEIGGKPFLIVEKSNERS